MARYATTDEMTIRMQLRSTPTADELAMLNQILDAVSRSIDRTCGMLDDSFLAIDEATTRYFVGYGEAYLRIPRCIEVESVSVKASLSAETYTAWATPTTPMAGDGDWIPATGDGDRPIFGALPYTLLVVDINGDHTYFLDSDNVPVVEVTAYWGHSDVVPADIREACLMQSIRWFKKFQAAMAFSGGTAELGQIIYRKALDNDVRQILIEGGWIVPFYGSDE